MASTFTIKQEGYDDPYTYRLGMVGNGVRLCIAAKKEGGSQLFRKEDENIWTSISYDNNGKYIACGRTPNNTGCISISSDRCETWSETKILGDIWAGVACGNGKYVVVGRNGYVGMSTDGENWNISQIDDNLSCLSIAYGNNMFIVVGNTISTPTVPKSYVLKNGSDEWVELKYSSTNFIIQSITYSEYANRFASVGSNLVALTRDTDYWDIERVADGADLYAIAYANREIAVGNHEEIYYNGANEWKLVPYDSPGNIIWLSVAYIPWMKAHIAVGTSGYSVAFTDSNNRTAKTRFWTKDLLCVINVV